MQHDPMTPSKLKITTHDTTLEALLTGAARIARFDTWPNVEPLELRDPFQDAVPCWQLKRYHLHKAHGREFICSVMSTETLVKLAFPYSNIEHAEMDADVFIISPEGH